MNFKTLSISLILFAGIYSCKQKEVKQYIPLINPASTEKTVNLYNFIQDIQGQYILSGQHNFVGKGSDYSNQLEEITGTSHCWGSDFSFCVEGENALRFQTLRTRQPGCHSMGKI